MRAEPPQEVSGTADPDRVRIAWNGEHWAVVWSETVDGEPAVFFARIDADGHRPRPPLRVSEVRSVAREPAVVWNRTAWSVFFAGGIHTGGDIYQARVTARGSAVGRPWRMTRGPRGDAAPAVAVNETSLGLAWVGLESTGRWSAYGESLDAWDRPGALVLPLRNTSLTLGATALSWTGTEWAMTYLAAGREIAGIEMVRMDRFGVLHGSLQRLTPNPIGDTSMDDRYAIAWSGARFGLAWTELRDGERQLLFRWLTARGNPAGEPIRIGLAAELSRAPSLSTNGDGTLSLAWETEREGDRRVAVAVVDDAGITQREPVTLRGVDGSAMRPAVAVSPGAAGVATRSARGISFHRVVLGRCSW